VRAGRIADGEGIDVTYKDCMALQRVIGHRQAKEPPHHLEYLIKWMGLAYQDCSWEPPGAFVRTVDIAVYDAKSNRFQAESAEEQRKKESAWLQARTLPSAKMVFDRPLHALSHSCPCSYFMSLTSAHMVRQPPAPALSLSCSTAPCTPSPTLISMLILHVARHPLACPLTHIYARTRVRRAAVCRTAGGLSD
jgi:hypothetical protein